MKGTQDQDFSCSFSDSLHFSDSLILSLSLPPSTLKTKISLTHSLILPPHSLSPVLIVMMKSKELKTKIYSHAHSLILSPCPL